MYTTLEQSQYGFDRDSRRTWQKRPLTSLQDQSYQYDALSQVSGAARGSLNFNATAISGIPSLAENWDYDPTGNWRGYHQSAVGSVTLDQQRVHDRGNRLTQIEDNPHNMIPDRVGRMRQLAPDASGDWDGKLEITWDAWSRITRVKNNGEVVGNYTYDGTHRRVTREVDEGTLHSYYNDAWRPVEERKDNETTAALSYLWGARHRDDLVRRDRAVGGMTLNETRYVLMDYFNPVAITDASGTVKERYAFNAFGVRTILNPDYSVRSSSGCAMEFAFQGQFADTESGLMNYGYRYYSPHLGRWTCKDPIEEIGGVNLFAAVKNGAINKVDYLGLDERKCCDFLTRENGKEDLRKQASKVKQQLEEFDKKMGGGHASCWNNHSRLLELLEMPICWECRREERSICYLPDGKNPEWTHHIPFHREWAKVLLKGGFYDHVTLICQAHDEEGLVSDEIILDITGGYESPEEWREYYPYEVPDGKSDWKSGVFGGARPASDYQK